jgi:Replication-relaxation
MHEPLSDRSRRAGHGISSVGLQWGRRPGDPPLTAITDRDVGLLLALSEAGYLSSSQLIMLGWAKDSSQARQRLKRLHDVGLTDKLRPYTPHGSYEWTYRLTIAGFQLLVSAELLEPTPVYKPAELHSASYIEHDLQVNALVLHIAQHARPDTGPGLLGQMPFQWQARTATIDLSPSETLHARERSPEALEAGHARHHHEQSLPGYLQPDAVLRGVDYEGLSFSVLIEYDRTRRPSKQTDRLRRYDRFLVCA